MQTPPNLENNPHHLESPYFIQHGEGASSLLVPELLTTKNYVTWTRKMRRTLNLKNKLGFIDGKISKPTNFSNHFLIAWERCNDMIIVWIQHSISFEHRSTIAHVDTASNIWNDLHEHFSIQNGPRIFQLTKAISSLA